LRQWYINKNYRVFGHYASSGILFKTQRFGNWILFPSSSKSLLSWAQSIEPVPISRHQRQHKVKYTNQTQHEPHAGVETKIKKKTFIKTLNT
jgi:hypothetical protein